MVDAVGEIPEHPAGVQYIVKGPATQSFHIDGLPLGTRGGMVVTHEFPADGEYELNIGNLAVALWVYNMEFKNTLIATLDGQKFWQGDLGGEEDMKAIDQKQDPAVDAINKRLFTIPGTDTWLKESIRMYLNGQRLRTSLLSIGGDGNRTILLDSTVMEPDFSADPPDVIEGEGVKT